MSSATSLVVQTFFSGVFAMAAACRSSDHWMTPGAVDHAGSDCVHADVGCQRARQVFGQD